MPRTPGSRNNQVPLLVSAWFVLAIVAVLWGVPHIEQSLAEEAEGALEGLPVNVIMSGREATLIAPALAAEEARARVEGIGGVRRATVDLVDSALAEVTVNPDNEPQVVEPVLADPSLTLRSNRGSFTLTGSLADDDAVAEVSGAAAATFGADRLIIDISVDPDTLSPAWLAEPLPLFAAVAADELGFEIYDKIMRVTGTVPDALARRAVLDALETHVAGGLEVHDRLVVVLVEEPLFSIESFAGSVFMRGTLPSQGEVNSLREEAERIYGPDSVAAWLTDPVAPALPYLTDHEAFFQAFEGRALTFLDVGGALVVRGNVPSEEVRTSIGESLTAVVDPRGLINELVVVEIDEATQSAIDAINDVVGGALKFNSGSTSLSESDMERLDEVAAIMEDTPDLRVVVEGHTDDRGTMLGNQRISEERAAAVVAYLIEVGIDSDRISAIGFGETRPIASNATSSGRSANRRIDFTVEGSN